MTCIVGLIDRGSVHLGGDACAIGGMEVQTRATPKVFRLGSFIIGSCGSFRLADVIRYHFTPPPPPPTGDLHRYMAVTFVEALREAVKARGCTKVEDHIESFEGLILVGVRDALFVIEDDFHVAQSSLPFATIGSGSDLARGALHVLRSGSPRTRLTRALDAAAAYNAGVRPPFHFVTLRRQRRGS